MTLDASKYQRPRGDDETIEEQQQQLERLSPMVRDRGIRDARRDRRRAIIGTLLLPFVTAGGALTGQHIASGWAALFTLLSARSLYHSHHRLHHLTADE